MVGVFILNKQSQIIEKNETKKCQSQIGGHFSSKQGFNTMQGIICEFIPFIRLFPSFLLDCFRPKQNFNMKKRNQ